MLYQEKSLFKVLLLEGATKTSSIQYFKRSFQAVVDILEKFHIQLKHHPSDTFV